VPLGLAAGASGPWLTLANPFVGPDGTLQYGMRLVVGSAMVLSIGLAVRALLRRDFARARAGPASKTAQPTLSSKSAMYGAYRKRRLRA